MTPSPRDGPYYKLTKHISPSGPLGTILWNGMNKGQSVPCHDTNPVLLSQSTCQQPPSPPGPTSRKHQHSPRRKAELLWMRVLRLQRQEVVCARPLSWEMAGSGWEARSPHPDPVPFPLLLTGSHRSPLCAPGHYGVKGLAG